MANSESDNVSAYTITATGALASISTADAGDLPSSVTIDPSGKFAYVNNSSSHSFGCVSPSVSAYTINASTGALSEVAGSPFASPSTPGFVVHPSGKFAYVANISCVDRPSHGISAYTIDPGTGVLSEVAGSPFTAGTNGVFIDRSGKFAYAANSDSDNVSVYIINATSGALSEVAGSPFAAGRFPVSVTFDPSGRFAYVVNRASNDLSAYTINPSTGALSEVAGSPFAAGHIPNLTITPTTR